MVRNQRPLEPLFPAGETDDRSTSAHRQLIGVLGLVLAPALWLVAAWRPTPGLPQWAPLDSVSSYYHSGAVAVFVGVVIALAIFLFIYQGYRNDYGHRDRIAAIIAAGAAVLVAFFPTAAPAGVPAPPWWTGVMGTTHLAAAVVLFSAFAFFALIQFPKSQPGGPPPSAEKRRRNAAYRVCGGLIVAASGWAGVAGRLGAPIFWAEVLALEAFAVSWLVKGRADRTAVGVGRRVWHYGRHPKQIVDAVRAAMRR